MKIEKVLKTETDYNTAIERTIELFDAKPGSSHFNELELLLVLIKHYEDKYFQIPYPDPIEAIKYKMEENGLKNKDLMPIIGTEGHVSAILSGKRNLTLEMARDINEVLGVPADILISQSSVKDDNIKAQLEKSRKRGLRLKELSVKLRNSNSHNE